LGGCGLGEDLLDHLERHDRGQLAEVAGGEHAGYDGHDAGYDRL
jgi:hypothetical protein